jgi:glutamate-5-semialdehyde dehydrogenase
MDIIREAATKAKAASYRLANVELEKRNLALAKIAEALEARSAEIMEANRKDLEGAQRNGLANVLVKRLKYDGSKIEESIRSIRSLMDQDEVVGKLIASTELDEGLILDKVSCPIGVIGVVFESRPDALVQISCVRAEERALAAAQRRVADQGPNSFGRIQEHAVFGKAVGPGCRHGNARRSDF